MKWRGGFKPTLKPWALCWREGELDELGYGRDLLARLQMKYYMHWCAQVPWKNVVKRLRRLVWDVLGWNFPLLKCSLVMRFAFCAGLNEELVVMDFLDLTTAKPILGLVPPSFILHTLVSSLLNNSWRVIDYIQCNPISWEVDIWWAFEFLIDTMWLLLGDWFNFCD